MTKLPIKLKKYRRTKRLTQEALGRASGTSKRYVCELEQGTVKQPSAEKLNSIASVLGLSIEFLIDDKHDEPSRKQIDQAFYQSYISLERQAKEQMRSIVAAFIN